MKVLMKALMSVQAGFAAVVGWISWFLGGWDGLLYALAICVAADYVSGVACAVVEKRLSSEIGAKGILKKVLIALIVGVSHALDMYVLGNAHVLRTVVVLFFVSNEGISLIENAARLGLPVPDRLKGVLEQLKDKEDKALDNSMR